MMAAILVACWLWLQMQKGFSAREQPSALEALIARRLRAWSLPRYAREMKNPVPATEENFLDARAHFADHCAICHANDGSGHSEIGQGLYPKPPDMRQSGTQSLTDGELFYIIHNGIRLMGMPAFGKGAIEQDEDSWKLVHFIRRIPKLTRKDLEEMEKMNPKSPMELEEEEDTEKFLEGEDSSPPKQHKH
jgi:mono/diheme cytochrome c family protein